MKPWVAVIDYGMGNLRSVQKALEQAGVDARVTDTPNRLREASGIVLPGVGAFGEAVTRLKSQGLWDPLLKALDSEKPFLGICLGYQLLFETSQESPGVRGLSRFQGPVVRFRFPKKKSLKVPHMGWNTLQFNPLNKSDFLKGLNGTHYFYFVHSFYPVPKDTGLIASTTFYGKRFASSVAQGSLFASQFHPEKSGRQGLHFLRNYVHRVKSC